VLGVFGVGGVSGLIDPMDKPSYFYSLRSSSSFVTTMAYVN